MVLRRSSLMFFTFSSNSFTFYTGNFANLFVSSITNLTLQTHLPPTLCKLICLLHFANSFLSPPSSQLATLQKNLLKDSLFFNISSWFNNIDHVSMTFVYGSEPEIRLPVISLKLLRHFFVLNTISLLKVTTCIVIYTFYSVYR